MDEQQSSCDSNASHHTVTCMHTIVLLRYTSDINALIHSDMLMYRNHYEML